MSPRRPCDQDAAAPTGSDASDAPLPHDPRRDDAADERVAARIESRDDSEACTLFPADADPEALVTTWLTAEGDAFVDLDDCR